jgi:transposase-like protein
MEMRRKGQHYSREFIEETLGELKSGVPRALILQKRGINITSLRGWVVRYGGGEVSNPTRLRFTEQQRRGIVRKVLLGEMTRQEACLAHGMTRATLCGWLAASKKDYNDIDVKSSEMPALRNSTDKELQKAHLKILALETLIDVAEVEFKIKIRKKSGAKQ